MSLGEAPKQLDLLDPVTRFCNESLPASSIHGFLSRERDGLGRPLTRDADFAVTMEIYTKVSSKATREALRKLGESLDGS